MQNIKAHASLDIHPFGRLLSPVLLKLWTAAQYWAAEVWLAGHGLTPEIWIVY